MGKIRDLKNKIMSKKMEFKVAATTAMASMMAMPTVSADAGKGTMIGIINTILPYIGIIGIPIVVVGAFKLVMAFRNDQGDAVPGAAKDIAIGIVLIGFGTIGKAVLSSI